MIPIRYNLRSLVVRKRTSLATASGIALVVFVLAAALMLADGIEKTMARSGKPSNAIVLRKGSQAELESVIEEPKLGIVLAASGVKKDASGGTLGVGEVIVVAALEKIGASGVSNVQIRGVPEQAFKFRPEVRIVEGRPAQIGSDEVIIGSRIRGRFVGVDLGGSFEFRKNRPVKVVGVFEADGSSFESEIWGDIETVKASFRREGMVSSVSVTLESASKFEAFKSSVEQDKQLGLEVRTESDYYARQSVEASIFIKGLGAVISFFFSIGAMIGAMITMYAAVAHRQREIGTLRALGFSRASVLFSFLFESVVLSLAGGAIGAAASLGMGFVKFSMINFVSWSEIVFSFTPTPAILAKALFFAGAMGLFGGLLPAVRAARMSPLKAIRD